jgi:hypothetical protein
MERTKIATAAMERSDRYLRDFVEALHLCPFARRCREDGKLHRRVLLPEDDALAAIREIEALPADSVEVALLIFPQRPTGSTETARAFEAFGAQVRQTMFAAHFSGPPFYLVAFHPDLPRDLGDAHRAVQFIRRSPDPTLQLVRASVLQAVRGSNGGERYVDSSKLSLEQMMALTVPVSTSDRIAEANLETLTREGPDKAESLLASLRPVHS